MREIQKCLGLGFIVTLAPGIEKLFKAEYKASDEEILFEEESDHGIDHLLMLLASKVLNNEKIAEKANRVYPYPLSIAKGELEHSLSGAMVDITKINSSYWVFVRKLRVVKGQPINFYSRGGKGRSIHHALRAALASTDFIPLATTNENLPPP